MPILTVTPATIDNKYTASTDCLNSSTYVQANSQETRITMKWEGPQTNQKLYVIP